MLEKQPEKLGVLHGEALLEIVGETIGEGVGTVPLPEARLGTGCLTGDNVNVKFGKLAGWLGGFRRLAIRGLFALW